MDAAARGDLNENITENVNLMPKAAVKFLVKDEQLFSIAILEPRNPQYVPGCASAHLKQDNYDFYVFQFLQLGNRGKDIFWCLFVCHHFI